MDIEAYEDVVQQLEHELTMLEAELEMTDQIINDLQSENESLIDEVLELESEYDSLVEGLDEYQDDQHVRNETRKRKTSYRNVG